MSTIFLTGRQLEFLVLTARGVSRQEIAINCFVSPLTVRDTLEAARGRLGARTLAHAVAIAFALGFLELDEDGDAMPANRVVLV